MAKQALSETYTHWLLGSAHSYLGQSMAPQAITLLELLCALQPDNQQALRMLVYAYLLAARYQRVLETATLLAQLDQTNREQLAYLSLLRARALWGFGKTDASKDEFQKYIELVSTLKSDMDDLKNG